MRFDSLEEAIHKQTARKLKNAVQALLPDVVFKHSYALDAVSRAVGARDFQTWKHCEQFSGFDQGDPAHVDGLRWELSLLIGPRLTADLFEELLAFHTAGATSINDLPSGAPAEAIGLALS